MIRMRMPHQPSGRSTAHGKLQNLQALWKYKLARRKARKVAKASRRRNRRG